MPLIKVLSSPVECQKEWIDSLVINYLGMKDGNFFFFDKETALDIYFTCNPCSK